MLGIRVDVAEGGRRLWFGLLHNRGPSQTRRVLFGGRRSEFGWGFATQKVNDDADATVL